MSNHNKTIARHIFFSLVMFTLVAIIPFSSFGQEKEKKEKSFFTISSDKRDTKEYSTDEIQRELDEKEGLLRVNSKAPAWKFILNNQSVYSSKKLEGKIYVLDFWGSWCPPCKKAMPTMERLHQVYKNRKDIVIIGISAKEKTLNSARNYFDKMDFSYIHLPNGDKVADVFNVKKFPTVFIINKKGIIVDAFIGFQEEGDFERIKKVIDNR
ncbi:TlpA family protein disulfide reductase [Hanstruepera marina]|uniref:TlpA family protein disulfide reductase n=1 Tax=Hanstruepera marina TaxID=2873265 RepID=UPI001CA6C160|nr:TlpA disulfide reductase family protein [Hanstruepera marina]